MKISGNNDIIKAGYPDKSRPSEQNSNSDFKDILKESVEKSSRAATQIQSPSSIDPSAAVGLKSELPVDKFPTINQVENFIDLLDDYRRKLADPAITLRSIEPVMKTIIREKDQLSSLIDSMPNEDGLKDIVNRALITASLEVIKFNRGDYITS